jgi:hypothetical protein
MSPRQNLHFQTDRFGGGSRIRTHEELTPLTVFKTAAIDHSAIPPCLQTAENIMPLLLHFAR